MTDEPLSLPEELLLLAFDDRTGGNRASQTLPYGLAAAVLVDLALRGRLRLEDERVAMGDAAPTGNPVLDEVRALIAGEAKAKKPAAWVGVTVQKIKRLPDRVARPLVERRVLKEEEGKVLGLFPVTRYLQRDRSVERDLHDRLRRAVSGSLRPDDRTAALLVLANDCDLLRTVFEGPHLSDAKERAKSLGAAESYTRPVRGLVAAVLEGLGVQLEQNRVGQRRGR